MRANDQVDGSQNTLVLHINSCTSILPDREIGRKHYYNDLVGVTSMILGLIFNNSGLIIYVLKIWKNG